MNPYADPEIAKIDDHNRAGSIGCDGPTALVVIPGSVNYFYNLNGKRIVEVLRELKFNVDLCVLQTVPKRFYDLTILAAPTEVIHSAKNDQEGYDRVRSIRENTRILLSSSMEAVQTEWFELIYRCCERIDVDGIIDFGFLDQRNQLSESRRSNYHFILNSLTSSELLSLEGYDRFDHLRKIPWAFVGHSSLERIRLVHRLVQSVDPRGLVYIPQNYKPCSEKSSDRLSQEKYDQILRRARYQVWCSHHTNFYIESERFRMSLLAGGVPIKILESHYRVPDNMPFEYLTTTEAGIAQLMNTIDFLDTRERFQDDFIAMPALRIGIENCLRALGIKFPTSLSDLTPGYPALQAA